ncbi:Secreted hydrolase [Mycena kentingensis (nom. inval.)]|nr:Secreted hydrolase [Mycena kentingensis (nom. inval.)]
MILAHSFVYTLAISAFCGATVLMGPNIDFTDVGAAPNSRDNATLVKRAQPQGIDVSDHQSSINWATVKANGVAFAYIKATEGSTFISPTFSSQYTGATNAGLIRGGYHFAHPDTSSGATQAKFFLAHGGGWSADGITLPGALDIEYNPSGAECYGLSASSMVAWIKDFSNTYHAATTRFPGDPHLPPVLLVDELELPVIYTTTDWWTTCTGNSAAFATDNPVWIARYSTRIGTLPAGWGSTTFWQYADSGPNPGDQNVFNGDAQGLKR